MVFVPAFEVLFTALDTSKHFLEPRSRKIKLLKAEAARRHADSTSKGVSFESTVFVRSQQLVHNCLLSLQQF